MHNKTVHTKQHTQTSSKCVFGCCSCSAIGSSHAMYAHTFAPMLYQCTNHRHSYIFNTYEMCSRSDWRMRCSAAIFNSHKFIHAAFACTCELCAWIFPLQLVLHHVGVHNFRERRRCMHRTQQRLVLLTNWLTTTRARINLYASGGAAVAARCSLRFCRSAVHHSAIRQRNDVRALLQGANIPASIFCAIGKTDIQHQHIRTRR